ncbi:hypothetical protein PHSC3_001508 [Chlamydiales bacterium STE3]|nr:hypothetical protein PHSC3_001508 [Chlamydiales bacterium STE3]
MKQPILIFFFLLNSFFFDENAEQLLNQVDQAVTAAYNEKIPAVKQEKYNQALTQLGLLEKKYSPSFGNGKLYYNLANAYYELGEYPWALFYYQKSLQLRPYDESVKKNLEIAKKQMSLENDPKPQSFASLLFLTFLPLPLRLQWFTLLCILFFAFWSFYLWLPSFYVKVGCYTALSMMLLALLSLGYSYYFAPIEGIVVHASYLYRTADQKGELLQSGSQVVILEVLDEGSWLKVITSQGSLGYLPSHSLKML